MSSPSEISTLRRSIIRALANYVRRLFRQKSLVEELRTFCDNAASIFDVLVLPSAEVYANLRVDAIVLDEATIDRLQVETNYPIGVFDPAAGSRLSQTLAGKVCRRLARHAAPQESTTARAFAAAWFYVIWTQICVILPTRHLARRLRSMIGDRLVLIPIESERVVCLDYWAHNELEPFVLAAELRRRGARVLLVAAPESVAKCFCRGSTLRFAASPAWNSPSGKQVQRRATSRLLVTLGLRNQDAISQRIGKPLKVGTINPDPDADVLMWSDDDNPHSIDLPLFKKASASDYLVLSPSVDAPGLADGFLRMLGPLSWTSWKNIQKAVVESGADEAHICDHLFFESALIAHAVASIGGSIFLWPHSSNAVHTSVHDLENVACVTAATVSAGRQWTAAIGRDDVRIDSGLLLMPASGPRTYSPGKPVHIVVFAGAHQLNRMPLLDCDRHVTVWRRLFQALNGLPDRFQVILKSKYHWESTDWILQLQPPENRFRVTDVTAAKLDLSNMIFLSVSFGTTALLEGLGRGIPAMIVRESPVEDYTSLSAEFRQVGDVEFVVSQIRACVDENYYTRLASKQLEWYEAETQFLSPGAGGPAPLPQAEYTSRRNRAWASAKIV